MLTDTGNKLQSAKFMLSSTSLTSSIQQLCYQGCDKAAVVALVLSTVDNCMAHRPMVFLGQWLLYCNRFRMMVLGNHILQNYT